MLLLIHIASLTRAPNRYADALYAFHEALESFHRRFGPQNQKSRAASRIGAASENGTGVGDRGDA